MKKTTEHKNNIKKEKAMFKRIAMVSIVASAFALVACGDLQELDQVENALEAPEVHSQEQGSAVDPSNAFGLKMAADDNGAGAWCSLMVCTYKIYRGVGGDRKYICGNPGDCCGTAEKC